MEIKIKSIRHNAIMNATLSVMQVIFPLITFPYVSRVLGVEANGRITFSAAVVSYFTLFATLGMTTYGIRACAQNRESREHLSKTVHELLLISTVTTSLMFICLIIATASVPRLRTESILIAINSLTLLLNVAGMNWLYSGIEQYDYITIRSVSFKILSVILMFAFVHSPRDIYTYAGITVFATAGPNILNMIHSRKYITYKWYGHYNWKRHLTPTLTLFAAFLAVNVYTNLDNIMLGFMTSDYEVGIYHASVRIKSVLTTMVTSLGAVLLPRLSSYLSNNRQEDFYNVLKKSFAFTAMAGISLSVYFFIFAREGILLLSGKEYLDSVIPMRILIFLIAITGFSNILGMQILIPSKCEKKYMNAVICGAVTDLVLNLFLIPLYGASGAALATFLAELMQFFLQIVYLRKEISKFADFRTFGKVLISCMAAVILVIPIKLLAPFHTFLMLLITGILYYTVFIIMLWILKYTFITTLAAQLTGGKIKR